jgi:predicted PurR-regulated permease PerM
VPVVKLAAKKQARIRARQIVGGGDGLRGGTNPAASRAPKRRTQIIHSDPILWGTVAFLLNYVPILGTALGVLIFLLAGTLTHDTLWQALLPAGLYFGFHLIEGETLTPMLLARWFTLNPVFVIISLVFWFWMWGIPGGILSMPMLAITKIICDRLQPLAAFGHFLEG